MCSFSPSQSLQGRVCGQGDLSSRPFLLIFDLTECLNPATLLAGCPTPQVIMLMMKMFMVIMIMIREPPTIFFLDHDEHLGVRGSLSFRELFTTGSFERCGRGGRKSEREDQTLLQVSSSLSNVHKQKANKHSLQPLRLAREIRSNSCWGAGKGKHMSCMVSSADIHSFYFRVTFDQWCVLEYNWIGTFFVIASNLVSLKGIERCQMLQKFATGKNLCHR